MYSFINLQIICSFYDLIQRYFVLTLTKLNFYVDMYVRFLQENSTSVFTQIIRLTLSLYQSYRDEAFCSIFASSKLVVNHFDQLPKVKKYQDFKDIILCTAVADEKYFYHIRISPYMLVFLDFTGFPAFPHFRGTCVFWHMSAGFSSEKL